MLRIGSEEKDKTVSLLAEGVTQEEYVVEAIIMGCLRIVSRVQF